jgi:multiple sugar transport system substrate-binding protein
MNISKKGGISRRNFLMSTVAVSATAGLLPRYASAQDFAGQEINVMIVQSHVVAGEMMAADFEAATGAKVNITAVPYDQVQQQATLDVMSGANRFDVIDYWYLSLGALATEGVIEDVTDWIERDTAEIQPGDFIPTIYDTYTAFEGRRWGLPYDGDTHVLFCNTEILERNGLEEPKTWDEYVHVAKTITEAEAGNGVYGAAMMAFGVPIIIVGTFVNRLAGYGGNFLNDDGSPALDSEAALAAAEQMLAAAPYCLPTPAETAFDQALPAFLSGKAAMMEFWTDLGVYAQDPGGSQIVDKWSASQLPTGPGVDHAPAALNAGFCFSVSKGSTKKDLAWEFIKFATSPDYSRKLLLTTGSGIDPIRVSGLNSDEYKAFAPLVQEAASASLAGVMPWPTSPQSPLMMEILSDQLSQMMAGQKTAADALTAAQSEWIRILG